MVKWYEAMRASTEVDFEVFYVTSDREEEAFRGRCSPAHARRAANGGTQPRVRVGVCVCVYACVRECVQQRRHMHSVFVVRALDTCTSQSW